MDMQSLKNLIFTMWRWNSNYLDIQIDIMLASELPLSNFNLVRVGPINL